MGMKKKGCKGAFSACLDIGIRYNLIIVLSFLNFIFSNIITALNYMRIFWWNVFKLCLISLILIYIYLSNVLVCQANIKHV